MGKGEIGLAARLGVYPKPRRTRGPRRARDDGQEQIEQKEQKPFKPSPHFGVGFKDLSPEQLAELEGRTVEEPDNGQKRTTIHAIRFEEGSREWWLVKRAFDTSSVRRIRAALVKLCEEALAGHFEVAKLRERERRKIMRYIEYKNQLWAHPIPSIPCCPDCGYPFTRYEPRSPEQTTLSSF